MTNDVLKNRPKYLFALAWIASYFIAGIVVQLPYIFFNIVTSNIIYIIIQGVIAAYIFCRSLIFLYQKISLPYFKENMINILRRKWFFSYGATIFFIVFFGFKLYKDLQDGIVYLFSSDSTYVYFIVILAAPMMQYIANEVEVVE